MKITLRSLMICVVSFAQATIVEAEDIYISQSGLGDCSGRDARNSNSAAFILDSGNWHSPAKIPGKIGPGDTVHLCGVIQTPLVIRAPGVSGRLIRIVFDHGATMSASNWNQKGANGNAAIYISKSFVSIDGGSNGLIEATSNGTERASQLYNIGVYVDNANDVSVMNLQIRNLYVRLQGSDPSVSRVGGVGVYYLGTCSNGLVSGCTISDVYYPIMIAFGTCSNFEVSNCELTNMSDGVVIGSANRGFTLNGAKVHDNHISLGTNWEGFANIHRTCIHAFAVHHDPDSSLKNLRIYNNWFTGDLSSNATAYCFIEGYVESPWVYNNLFVQPNLDSGGDGFLAFKGTENAKAMNNTFVGSDGGKEIAIDVWPVKLGAELGHNLTIMNNIFYHCASAIYDSTPQVVASDYNLFDGDSRFKKEGFPTFANLQAWRAVSGLDNHSFVGHADLDPVSYVPMPGSTAIGKGNNESALFVTDLRQVKRSAYDSWDVGAIEHNSGR